MRASALRAAGRFVIGVDPNLLWLVSDPTKDPALFVTLAPVLRLCKEWWMALGPKRHSDAFSPKELCQAFREVHEAYVLVIPDSAPLHEVWDVSHSKLGRDPITAAIHGVRKLGWIFRGPQEVAQHDGTIVNIALGTPALLRNIVTKQWPRVLQEMACVAKGLRP